MAAVLAADRMRALATSPPRPTGRSGGNPEVQSTLPTCRRFSSTTGHPRPPRPNLRPEDLITHRGIPTTTPIRTLLDLATILTPNQLEAAVSETDVLDLIDPETLRAELESRKGRPGVRPLRALLDRHTYRMTETELERRFLRIVKSTGLPLPETQQQLAGRTDFHWPALGLVVETDGWRYHRTAARQARDNRRMQAPRRRGPHGGPDQPSRDPVRGGARRAPS